MDLNLDECLEPFTAYLKQKGKSPNTIRPYLCAIRLYASLYSQLNPANLRAYRAYLLSHYRINTVNARIYAVNCFLDSLRFSFRLEPVRQQQCTYLDCVISQRDYEKLKRRLRQDHNFYWYFVVRFLGATGARISELLQIKVENLKSGRLDLYTKGGKMRRLYLPRRLCDEALAWFGEKGITSGFIFLNHRGQVITSRGVAIQLKHLAVRYHIDPDTVYPHSFRHRFAKNFLKKYNDIALLADLMGHDSIETTRIYLTRSSAEQKELLDRIITW